jgi:glycosyltransferase involved in cell wall biosynthesis
MACGAPVVISKTDGFWEPDAVEDGTHLTFVEGGDPKVWAALLRKLLDDEKVLGRFSERGMSLVQERYTARDFADRILSLV